MRGAQFDGFKMRLSLGISVRKCFDVLEAASIAR
jgi:hypothetical protein